MLPDQINVPVAEASASQDGYVHRVLVAFDVFVNVLFRGRMDETISARSYRAALQGKLWGKVMNAFLNLFQANHGALAAAGDLERADSVAGTEQKTLDTPSK
jgi:hypothetical protein